eukprot:augustus_masked-scaffold_22-processed-gene-0.12-mRNA-1 protein AED:1.00 eAED:1.00 QI:0/0/0/0/1/1/2/0/263
MKFQNIFVFFPLTLSKLNLGEHKNEKELADINSILRIVKANFEVTAQDCTDLDLEEFELCIEPFNTALAAAADTLSDEERSQAIDILNNPELTPEETREQLEETLGEGVLCPKDVEDGLVEILFCANLCADEICEDVRQERREELSLEEKAEQITAIIGNPGLCTPEFIEVLPRIAFCFYKCEDGFCEAKEAKLGREVTKIAAQFGCELVLDDVCKVFDEVQEPIDAGDGSDNEESGDTAEIYRDMRAGIFAFVITLVFVVAN